MKKTEYKIEVEALTLSEEFKTGLKQKMLEEYESRAEKEENIVKTKNSNIKKYSKYVALAACLLLTVSAVGGALALSGKIQTKSAEVSDFAQKPETGVMNDTLDGEGAAEEPQSAPGEIYADGGAELPAAKEAEDVDEAVEDVAEDAEDVAEDAYDDSVEDFELLTAPANDASADEPENGDNAENISTVMPMSGNGYSYGVSPDYDGRYDGGAYVFSGSGSESNFAANIYQTAESVSISAETIYPPSLAPSRGTGGEIPADGELDDAPLEMPADAPDEEVEYPESYDVSAEDAAAIDFEALTGGFSYEYYDIRDGVIANLDETALIRFEIDGAYDGYEAVAKNITAPTYIDLTNQTLYSVRITYDYFNDEEVSVKAGFINIGTSENQLVGRPLMEGEYIAVVYQSGGVLEPVPQLIYSVKNVNGLDVAYHVYSDDGFMVDPGDTNMGLEPEELEVVTSTVNNPEIYTQKAAVSELTRYLKRNIMRMEPQLIDLGSLGAEPEGEQEPQPERRSGIKANYQSGGLRLEYSPDEDGLPKINGVEIGTDMETALKALYLTEYSFTPDAILTLYAAEEDGGWEAKIGFEDGVVVKIEIEE